MAGAPKLLSQKTAKKLMEAQGWSERRGGKHVIVMTKPGERPIALPKHRGQTYGKKLSAAIKKEAGLT